MRGGIAEHRILHPLLLDGNVAVSLECLLTGNSDSCGVQKG